MKDIECPYCEKMTVDSADIPDHEAGDTVECIKEDGDPEENGCGEIFKLSAIEWDPVYYTEKIQ